MANEFKVKNGLIVIGDLTTSGTITINGALAATQSWVTSQAYLTSASLSGYATQSYVTSAIAALVDSAPAALDTLNELAAALGDDANFSTTITTSIGNKVSKSGDTMTGSLLFTAVANNVRLEKSGSFLNLLDTYSNIHLYNGGNGVYVDSPIHYWRSAGAVYWMTLGSSGLNVAQNITLGTTGGSIGDTNSILFPTVNGTHAGVPNGIYYTKKGNWGGQIDIRTSYDWGYSTDNAKISLNGAAGNGITFSTGASALGSTERVRIDELGNVGIGNTSPSATLDILTGSSESSGNSFSFTGYNSKTYVSISKVGFIRSRASDLNGANMHFLDNGGTTRMEMAVNTTSMTWYSHALATNFLVFQHTTGNVGIGTTNPAFKFEVGAVGSGYVSAKLTQSYEKVRYNNFDLLGYSDGHLWMIGNNNPSIVLASSWDWDNQVEFDYVPNTVGAAAGVLSIGQTNKNNANYTHGITRFFTNGSERLKIDSTGNVGIGTVSPSEKLHVVGNVKVEGSIGVTNIVTNYVVKFNGSILDDSIIYDNGTNIGIGTTSPGAKLHVVGNTYIQSGVLFVDTIAGYATNLVSLAASTNVLVPSGDITIGSAASTSSSQPFGDFSQLKFDNLHSDTNRGPNKIVMHDNGGSWIGGFGIHSDTVSYYTGGHHRWYKTTSQTSSDQVMQLDASGNLSVTGTFSASGYNSSNWNTAYSWGNHASAGYVTSSGSVNYANSAGYAATAGALTSMNISQFTNNSGYFGPGSYSWTSPVFGQYGIKSNLVDNVLYSAADRFEVFKDGVAWNTNSPFNLNYDQWVDIIPVNTSRTYSIVLNTKGNGSSGITYTEGYVYLSFYYVQIPASVSGRVRRQNGTWENISGWTNVANNASYAVWRGNVPGGNYMVEIEITINSGSSVATWFSQWEYVMGRPGQYELGIINKAQDNSLWRNMYFRDSSNNVQVSIGASGLSTSQNLHISGTSALYFPSYGGGFYMQDSSWIRTVNYKSIWTQTGLLGTDGGLTVGYGGATPPSGGAIISGNVGIGTTSPGYKLEVNGTFGVNSDATFNGTNTYINSSVIVVGNNSTDIVGISGNTMYFPGNGNVGIGTTSPTQKLHIVGTGASNDGITIQNTNASGNSQLRFLNTSGTERAAITYVNGADVVYHYTAGGGNLLNLVGANVGIGTTGPGSKLSILGNNDVLSVTSQTGDTSLPTKMLAQYVGLFNNGVNGHHLYINSSQELGSAEFNITKTWGGYLTFGVSGDGTARTRALYVNANGYVGVNVNPISGDRFEVAGSVRIHTGNNWDAIQIYSDGANGYIQGLGDETGLRIRSEYGNILLADNRGKVGIGTSSPSEEFHVLGRGIFDGGSGNSSTDAVLYVTKSNNNDWGLYVNAAALDYGMYARVSPSANYAIAVNNGTSWTTRITGDGRIYLNEKDTIASYDTWLRLNESSHYGSGVYTPGVMRADGGFYIGGNAVWYPGNDGSGSGLDADLLDGQHGSYFINTSNIGSQSVASATTSTSTYRGIIEDTRAAERTPNDYDDYRVSWEFTNQIPGLNYSGASWWSAMTMQGWHNGYSAWQIIGSASSAIDDFYLRAGNNTTWNTARRIWHSGDFTSTNVSNWNTAYGWGNHASAGYLTSVTAHTQAWSTITSTPTTISGYGITNAYTDTQIQNFFNGANAISGYNKSNWDTAYGWGNHASSGYIVAGSTISDTGSWTNATKFKSSGDISYGGAGNHSLQIFSDTNNDAFIAFHISGDHAVYFGLDDASNRLHTGGWSDGANKYQLWDTRDFTSTNISNWSTSYSWGNHASAGYATTSYVTTQINNLIAGAPGALDTLDELAAALGDDSNFATTVTNSIATKLPLSGGTMTGDVNWTQTDRGLTWNMNTDGAYIKFYNTGDGDTNSRLEYATSDNGDEYHRWVIGGTEKMTLKSAGLTINGTITATGYNNTNWDTAYSSLANYLLLAGGTMSGSINMNGNNVINIGQVNATHAIFTNDGSSRVMYLRGSGNIIQFQNAAATDKWEIVGRDGEFYVYKSDGAGSGYKWRIDGVGNHTITGNLTVTGTITESSSLKLKENIETSEGNLEKVVNLRPVTYNKIGSQTTELGLIAEEVAEVYPEFVQYDENGEPIGVHYSRLTAALIGAVKELTNQVQELNKKING
jgi:hypothetical protein